ncbi:MULTISPECIES: DsbA family protein [Natrialbaceae]|uniref:DsbA family protein n=1 Tax=Natrialbaceae TaxID=1644061 RepID=UPI00207CA431|nr:thioredoxin domain-containing protein [Natronococcus sp. CG52]
MGLSGCVGFLSDSSEGDETTPSSPGGAGSDGTNDGNESLDETDANGDEPDEVEELEEPETDDLEEPGGALAEIPIPEEPDSTYPLVGSGDAPVTVRLFGNWKCPYTNRFLHEEFDAFVDEYVRPGTVDLEVHAVAYRDGRELYGEDGPRMARAGLAVWEHDPEQFWSFVEYVLVNVGGSDWATPDRIEAVAREAGVDDPERIRAAVEDDAYEDRIEKTTEYVRELPVSRVPRISVEGEPYSPNAHREELDEAIEEAVENATE